VSGLAFPDVHSQPPPWAHAAVVASGSTNLAMSDTIAQLPVASPLGTYGHCLAPIQHVLRTRGSVQAARAVGALSTDLARGRRHTTGNILTGHHTAPPAAPLFRWALTFSALIDRSTPVHKDWDSLANSGVWFVLATWTRLLRAAVVGTPLNPSASSPATTSAPAVWLTRVPYLMGDAPSLVFEVILLGSILLLTHVAVESPTPCEVPFLALHAACRQVAAVVSLLLVGRTMLLASVSSSSATGSLLVSSKSGPGASSSSKSLSSSVAASSTSSSSSSSVSVEAPANTIGWGAEYASVPLAAQAMTFSDAELVQVLQHLRALMAVLQYKLDAAIAYASSVSFVFPATCLEGPFVDTLSVLHVLQAVETAVQPAGTKHTQALGVAVRQLSVARHKTLASVRDAQRIYHVSLTEQDGVGTSEAMAGCHETNQRDMAHGDGGSVHASLLHAFMASAGLGALGPFTVAVTHKRSADEHLHEPSWGPVAVKPRLAASTAETDDELEEEEEEEEEQENDEQEDQTMR
jgi:hypothetical protein